MSLKKIAAVTCMIAVAAFAADASAGEGCTKSAAAKTASAGCASQTATAQLAGAGCTSGAKATQAKVAIETVRLPSGTLAVFYNGKDADTVAYLHSAANGSPSDFGCGLAKDMASKDNCTVEMAVTETGVMFLCSSDDTKVVDAVEKNYEVAMAGATETPESE